MNGMELYSLSCFSLCFAVTRTFHAFLCDDVIFGLSWELRNSSGMKRFSGITEGGGRLKMMSRIN